METFGLIASMLLIVGGMFGLVFLSILVRAYVLHTLWGWFIVTMFGLPHLGMAQALALSLTAGYLLNTTKVEVTDNDGKKKKPIGGLVQLFLHPAIILLIGWILHRFFM